MTWVNAGGPARLLPLDVDFYDLSNEDIGFTAVLAVAGVNTFSWALPYPAGINLFEETIRVYAIDYYSTQPASAEPNAGSGMQIWHSMLDKSFATSWDGLRDDAEDENVKAHFSGPDYTGTMFPGGIPTAALDGTNGRPAENFQNLHWFPPTEFLDLVTPLFVQFVNQTFSYNTVTGAGTAIDMPVAFNEAFGVRVWFKPRRLTSAEISSRSNQLRWQRLDS